MPNHCLCDQLYIRISASVHSRAARSTPKRTSFKGEQHVSLVLCVSLFYKKQRSNIKVLQFIDQLKDVLGGSTEEILRAVNDLDGWRNKCREAVEDWPQP